MTKRHTLAYGTICAVAVAAALVLMTSGPASAYPRWGDEMEANTCSQSTCHGDFRGTGGNGVNEHSFHVNEATGSCELCHWAPDSRNSPYTYKATTGTTAEFPGCVGCHGTDYGNSLPDQPNLMQAPGLRIKHEEMHGAGTCITTGCHDTNEPSPPNPENTVPPYYLRGDVGPSDPCDGGSYSTGGEDLGLGSSGGLDNDGDGTYDAADPDCQVSSDTPGEAVSLELTAYDSGTANITVSWTNACTSLGHAAIWGPLTRTDLENYNYTGQDCSLGTTPPYTTLNPDGGATTNSYFFLVVGDDQDTTDGSYGIAFDGDGTSERPQYTSAPLCDYTQNLVDRCD
jgi:hypothetical protein